jgi:PAS domain S-box-containing protein
MKMVGARDSSDVVGKPALHFLHPDCVPLVKRRIQRVVEEHLDVPMVTEKFVRVDGSEIDVEVAGLALEYEGRPSVQVIARDVSERVRQERELRRSEERYRGLVEGASEAIYRLNMDCEITAANPATRRITGWSEDQLKQMSLKTLIHPDDLPAALTAYQTAIAGTPISGVFRVVTPGDGVVHLDTTITPEWKDGTIVGLFGMARDITAAVYARQQIEDRERLLATVLERLPVGVVITDSEGEVVRSNAAARDIWSAQAIHTAMRVDAPYRGWWADSGKPLAKEDWASSRTLISGEMILNELIDIEAFDGVRKTILNSAVPLRDDEGRISGAVILIREVTEQRRSMQAREAMAARLRQVISSTSDGICTIDGAGKTTLINPAAVDMLGRPEE